MRFAAIIRTTMLLAPILPGAWAHADRQAAPNDAPMLLDRVVAVVNNQVILSSDVVNELRLSALEPEGADGHKLTPDKALDQLISRALIQQQTRREETPQFEPAREEIESRLAELRKELPACVRAACATDSGWNQFLATHGLTQAEAENYIRLKLEMLSFVENRFRQGIHISQEEIETYYNHTLLPQYLPGQAVPSLDAVAPRISEILLQQEVNLLFDNWLESLRKQGDIEILDSALVSTVTQNDGAHE